MQVRCHWSWAPPRRDPARVQSAGTSFVQGPHAGEVSKACKSTVYFSQSTCHERRARCKSPLQKDIGNPSQQCSPLEGVNHQFRPRNVWRTLVRRHRAATRDSSLLSEVLARQRHPEDGGDLGLEVLWTSDLQLSISIRRLARLMQYGSLHLRVFLRQVRQHV